MEDEILGTMRREQCAQKWGRVNVGRHKIKRYGLGVVKKFTAWMDAIVILRV